MKNKTIDFVKKLAAIRKSAIIIIAILLVGFFGARRFLGNGEQAQYITSQVERATLVNSIQASGSIINAGQQTVTTEATGVVKDIDQAVIFLLCTWDWSSCRCHSSPW